MKVANILPQSYLRLVQEDKYHMALAHLIQDPAYQLYTSFFKAQAAREDSFVIMDTGLIEGNARPIDELLTKAKYLQVDEMVLNDVFMEKDASLRETEKAREYVAKNGQEGIQLMGIPQGKTVDQWVEAAKEILQMGIDTIGVPKVLVHLEGPHARLKALLQLSEFITPDTNIHLLGCWENPIELATISNYERQERIVPVRGVDTVIAYAFAKDNLRFSDGERPQGPIDFLCEDIKDTSLLEYNMLTIKEQAAFNNVVADDKIITLY